jgi:hypothetical protein
MKKVPRPRHHAATVRTPLARMLPRVMGSGLGCIEQNFLIKWKARQAMVLGGLSLLSSASTSSLP